MFTLAIVFGLIPHLLFLSFIPLLIIGWHKGFTPIGITCILLGMIVISWNVSKYLKAKELQGYEEEVLSAGLSHYLRDETLSQILAAHYAKTICIPSTLVKNKSGLDQRISILSSDEFQTIYPEMPIASRSHQVHRSGNSVLRVQVDMEKCGPEKVCVLDATIEHVIGDFERILLDKYFGVKYQRSI